MRISKGYQKKRKKRNGVLEANSNIRYVLLDDVRFGTERLNGRIRVFGCSVRRSHSKIIVHTCKCAQTGQLKQIQEVCPLLSENPSDFFLFFSKGCSPQSE